jgi:hypothetical protein
MFITTFPLLLLHSYVSQILRSITCINFCLISREVSSLSGAAPWFRHNFKLVCLYVELKIMVEWTLLIVPLFEGRCGTLTIVKYANVVLQLGPRWHSHPSSLVTVGLASTPTQTRRCVFLSLLYLPIGRLTPTVPERALQLWLIMLRLITKRMYDNWTEL